MPSSRTVPPAPAITALIHTSLARTVKTVPQVNRINKTNLKNWQFTHSSVHAAVNRFGLTSTPASRNHFELGSDPLRSR